MGALSLSTVRKQGILNDGGERMFERNFLTCASALVTGGARFIGRKVKGFLADSGASIAQSLGSGMLGPRKIACGSRGWML
jgi:hypothetical protein